VWDKTLPFLGCVVEYGEDFFQKVGQESTSMGTMASHLVSWLINRLKIPIGYVNSYLLMTPDEGILSLFLDMETGIGAELNPFLLYTTGVDTETGVFGREQIPARKLLIESFNLEKIKTKFKLMLCSRYPASFYRFDFKFCPLCGNKLEEKIA
jgi:hypothetical protein